MRPIACLSVQQTRVAPSRFCCHNRKSASLRRFPVARVSQSSDNGAANKFAETAKKFVETTGRDIGKKASEVTEQINESAEKAYKEADRKYSISTKIRHAVTDVKRRTPYWKKRFSEFSSTPVGKVVLWVTFFFSISTGFLFKALNMVFLLWWVLPLLLLPFAGMIRKSQERATAQQNRDAEAEAERARNPFSAFGSQFGGSRSRKRQETFQDDGPVIDAVYTTVDDESKRR